MDSSNQEAKKKKKKKNKQEGNQAAIAMDATNVEKSSNQPWKLIFPCMLCKGDRLLWEFPSIP